MPEEIQIKKRSPLKGDDGHKVVSVRMTNELLARIDEVARQTNRSRNEIINHLLDASLDIVKIVD